MNTAKNVSLALASALILVACNQNNSETETPETLKVLENELAVASSESPDFTSQAEEKSEELILYVTARTGLSLREFDNLQSEKLDIIPYGAQLKVLAHESKNTMKVSNIKGGMDQVVFNRKTGYVFNGYLSKYFPPEEDMLPMAYANELKTEFPKVSYNEIVGGTTSKPVNTETLVLPDAKWHESYFIAQEIFNIPAEFKFPKITGEQTQQIKGPKQKKDSWFDTLDITRDATGITGLVYTYQTKKIKRTVSLSKVKEGIKIEQVSAFK